MTEIAPFWIDSEYDREASDDGVSRYGAYIRQATFEPWTDDDRHVEWAVFAWRCATGPVMVPGYVRRHGRIMSAQLKRSDWDGSLIASVEMVTDQPKPLQYLRAGEDDLWRDWPVERAFVGGPSYYEPGGDELARSAYLLTAARLLFTVPSAGLPLPPPLSRDAPAVARDAVRVLVGALNAIIAPVLARTEGSDGND